MVRNRFYCSNSLRKAYQRESLGIDIAHFYGYPFIADGFGTKTNYFMKTKKLDILDIDVKVIIAFSLSMIALLLAYAVFFR